MRYRLRTLLILLGIAPPVLAVLWWHFSFLWGLSPWTALCVMAMGSVVVATILAALFGPRPSAHQKRRWV